MADITHPFYEAQRGALEATMRHRLDLAEGMLRERAGLSGIDGIRQEVMDEFAIVLARMPYVGGAANRMTGFFMRLLGFMAIGRVLRRRGVPVPTIGEIARDIHAAEWLALPEAERLAAGRDFMSADNQAHLRGQADTSASQSHRQQFPDDFVYDVVVPAPGDTFEFGIDYKACGFCKFAARHGDQDILPAICGLDFAAYAAQGIRLERTQTLAGGASHCNFRFSRLAPG